MEEFTRDFNRYLVFKTSDIHRYLSSVQQKELNRLAYTIENGRRIENRGALTAVLVESDWPEYEIVWKMIEDRVNGRSCSSTS